MVTMNTVNLSAEKGSSVDISEDIWAVKPRKYLLTEIIHWQRAKRRQGTQSAKTRGEVHGTNKKPYKQKGTGNARHGDMKAPNMVGGGVAFAPKPRNYDYHMPKAKKRAALVSALSIKVQEGNVCVLENFSMDAISTKKVADVITKLGFDGALIVDTDNAVLKKSARNLQNVKYLNEKGLNVYDLLKYKTLIITKDAIKNVEDRILDVE